MQLNTLHTLFTYGVIKLAWMPFRFPNRNLGVKEVKCFLTIRCVLGAYWLFNSVRMHTERHLVAPKNSLYMLKKVLIDYPNMVSMWSGSIRALSIWYVRKTFGKHVSCFLVHSEYSKWTHHRTNPSQRFPFQIDLPYS